MVFPGTVNLILWSSSPKGLLSCHGDSSVQTLSTEENTELWLKAQEKAGQLRKNIYQKFDQNVDQNTF